VNRIAEVFNLCDQTVQFSAVRVFNPSGHTVQFYPAYPDGKKFLVCGHNYDESDHKDKPVMAIVYEVLIATGQKTSILKNWRPLRLE